MNGTRIQGHFLATSYWHVTQDTDANVTRLMKSKVVLAQPQEDGSAPYSPPTVGYVPVLPSNSLRGQWHRHCLSILTDALLEKGEFITKDTYQMLSNGGMIGGAESGPLTIGEAVRAHKHVYVGLWGGGPRLLPSSVVTCDLMPVCAETVQAGIVPQKLLGFAPQITVKIDDAASESQPATASQLIWRRMFKRNDDMMSLNRDAVDRFQALGEDGQAIVQAHQIEQMGFREDRRTAKEDKKDSRLLTDEEKDAQKKKDLVNFLEIEVVAPGTVWPVDLRLGSTCTAAQIALAAASLTRLINTQRFGSFSRWGFGQYRAYLDVIRDDVKIASIVYDAESQSHHLVYAEPGYEEALSAALQDLSAKELNEFAMANPLPKRPRKASATASTAADTDESAE